MQALKTKPIDDFLLGTAVLLFIGSGLRVLLGGAGDAARPTLPDPGPKAAYQAAMLTNPETATEVWTAPVSSGEPDEWLFDVFTPPVIYYDVSSQAFSVTPPDAAPTGDKAMLAAFGLELHEVRRTPFRIQLVGYVGGEGDYIATFEDVEAGTTFVARPGKTVEESGMVLRSLKVDKVRDDSNGGTTVRETKATAVIRDLRQDRDVTLVQNVKLMNDAPTAVFHVTGEPGRKVDGRQGATITTAGGTFEIGIITIDPPTAEVTREALGDRPMEVRRLEPVPIATTASPEEPAFRFPTADPKFNPFGSP